jgi:hypothetical protein
MWVFVAVMAAAAAQATLPDVVPFTLHRGHLLLVTGSVGTQTNLTFLLDTGSGRTVLTSHIAAALNLRGRPTRLASFGQTIEAIESVAPDLKVAGFTATAHSVVVTDLASTAASLQLTQLHGIIGIDLLRTRSFEIDYRHRVLRFGPAPARFNRIPFSEHPFLIVLLAVVDGRRVQLGVDTGASDLVLFSGRRSPSGPTRSAAALSGPALVRRLTIRELRIGTWLTRRPQAVEAPFIGRTGIDGLLGVHALGARYVHFDFDRREFGWSR